MPQHTALLLHFINLLFQELFIKDLAKKVHSSLSDPSGDISYNDLANLVNTDDAYSFLDGRTEFLIAY